MPLLLAPYPPHTGHNLVYNSQHFTLVWTEGERKSKAWLYSSIPCKTSVAIDDALETGSTSLGSVPVAIDDQCQRPVHEGNMWWHRTERPVQLLGGLPFSGWGWGGGGGGSRNSKKERNFTKDEDLIAFEIRIERSHGPTRINLPSSPCFCPAVTARA